MEKLESGMYICLDCGESHWLNLEDLQSERDVIRVKCHDCGKDFLLTIRDYGNETWDYLTYKPYDINAMFPVLRDMFNYLPLPFTTIDTMLKHAKNNRWTAFKGMVQQYSTIIGKFNDLRNYLEIHSLFVV